MAVHPRKKNTMSLVIPFLVVIVFFTVMIVQKYRASHDTATVLPQQHSEGSRPVILFFAKDGASLAREARGIEPCADDNACLKNILEELLNGPVGELDEPFPEGVAVESAIIAGNQAIIGFNRVFSEGLLSGSAAEMVAVYSVVDTVAVNFPQIQTVKIDVDGNKHMMLRHLDLSEPLVPDYTLEQLPQTGRHEK